MRATRASVAAVDGLLLAAALLLVPGLSAQAQEGIDEVPQKDYAFLDDFPNLDSRLPSFPEIKSKSSEEAQKKALERNKQELESDPNV